MKSFFGFLGRKTKSTPAQVSTRLNLDHLEDRWVPSGITSSTSSNWSGYAVSGAGSVTAVSGSWTVPAVSGSGTTYSSTWVGIDGYGSNSVEQIGISMEVHNGAPTYYAWYEMYPAWSVPINSITVHPGDAITASVTYNAGVFTLTIHDGSQSFTTNQTYTAAQRSSAEWIVEAPSGSSGQLPLANFGSQTLSNASATINGVSGPINNSSWVNNTYKINMVNGPGATVAATSALSSAGNAFTVAFGSTTPPTPGGTTPTPTPPPPPAPPPVSSTGSITTLTASTVTRLGWGYSMETLTVTVKPQSGTSLPTGTITLIYGGKVLGTASLHLVNGVETATFQILFYGSGSYSFTAQYSGSGTIHGSTSNVLTVNV